MASEAYTKPRYMKLLVSNSTNTLVPTKASERRSMPRLAGRLGRFAGDQRARGAVRQHLHGRLGAFGEGVDLLRDAVFEMLEIAWLQAVDVVVMAVGDGEAEHHHVHLHAEHRALRFLRLHQRRARGRRQKHRAGI